MHGRLTRPSAAEKMQWRQDFFQDFIRYSIFHPEYLFLAILFRHKILDYEWVLPAEIWIDTTLVFLVSPSRIYSA